MRKIFIWIFIVCFILVVTIVLVNRQSAIVSEQNLDNLASLNEKRKQVPDESKANVREFALTSFLEMDGQKPRPQFSQKELSVKKGEIVRLKITAKSGMHDFKIDEYNVYADTPLNQEVTVEFVADKSGSFIYYCTKPGHRQNGHFGTLTVVE